MNSFLKFIGTGSGKTSLKRYHSSIYFSSQETNLLIDCGDSTSKALLSAGISFEELNHIIFSHFHADHFGGIASLITQMKLVKREKRLEIFVPPGMSGNLIQFLESTYMFNEILNFDLIVTEYSFYKWNKLSADFKIKPLKNSHISNKHNLEKPSIQFHAASFEIIVSGRNVFYTGDIGNEKDLNLISSNSEIVIVESTHVEFKKILEFQRHFLPQKLILTHVDDEMESDLKTQIDSHKNRNIQLAFDRLTINL